MLPPRIGRFKVTEHLGSGGMGEVYKAYDDKLRRWVAIKAILPTRSLRPEHREQLRREARAAAAISHDAVAKIFDLVSEGEHDYLVFEFVEGESLRSLLRDRPLTMNQALRIGLDIAEGLQAAHASGIIHRDLKLENVMITPAGQAKILDLGLAKVSDATDDPEILSALPGTLSAMSPEQIRHRGNVDHRSDLFSLGTLLFQLLTGKHPFRDGLPPITLSNILTVDPPLPHKINPELPLSVSRLITRLLSKDPKQRPAGAREVIKVLSRHCAPRSSVIKKPRALALITCAAVLVLAAAVVGRWLLPGASTSSSPRSVAVLETKLNGNAKIDQELELVGEMVQLATVNLLTSLSGIDPIPSSELSAYTGGREEAGRAAAADVILTTSVSMTDSDYVIYLTPFDAVQGHHLRAGYAVVPSNDLAKLADTVVTNLKKKAFPDLQVLPGTYRSLASHQDYRELLQVYRSARRSRSGEASWHEHLNRLKRIRESAPGLLDAHVLEISIAAFLIRHEPDPAIVANAEEALARATAIAPDDQRTLRAEAELALALHDHERAQKAIDRLGQLALASGAQLELRARLVVLQGNHDQALALMSRSVESRPSAHSWFKLGLMAISMDRTDQGRTYLQRGFERLPPGAEPVDLPDGVELPDSVELLRRQLGLDRPWVY
jgi:serine/threonine protein kinase